MHYAQFKTIWLLYKDAHTIERCPAESGCDALSEVVEIDVGRWQTYRSDVIGERNRSTETQQGNVIDDQLYIIRRMNEYTINRRQQTVRIRGTTGEDGTQKHLVLWGKE